MKSKATFKIKNNIFFNLKCFMELREVDNNYFNWNFQKINIFL